AASHPPQLLHVQRCSPACHPALLLMHCRCCCHRCCLPKSRTDGHLWQQQQQRQQRCQQQRQQQQQHHHQQQCCCHLWSERILGSGGVGVKLDARDLLVVVLGNVS